MDDDKHTHDTFILLSSRASRDSTLLSTRGMTAIGAGEPTHLPMMTSTLGTMNGTWRLDKNRGKPSMRGKRDLILIHILWLLIDRS